MTPGEYNRLVNNGHTITDMRATPLNSTTKNTKEVSDGSTADYYVLPENATELQDLISHKNMNAQIGEIFRACYRYGGVAHSPEIRDIKKILFYAKAELERLQLLERRNQ